MTDTARLTLIQWLSPSFPLGSFAYSHGLEAAIAGGQVAGADALHDWIAAVIDRGSGRADAILLVAAMAPGVDHGALDDLAGALAASAERWEETRDQGAAFTDTVNAMSGRSDPPAAFPVAVGRAAAGLDLPPDEVAAQFLHAFASTLVSGAVRFMPLGQTVGQRVLARLHPLILRVAAEAARAQPGDITASAIGADLSAMAHETQEVRIFRT